MFEKLRLKLAYFLARDYLVEFEGIALFAEHKANQRIAKIFSKIDPLEMILRDYNGIFSEEFEHPEEKLDVRGQLGMKMWAYQQKTDPHFNFMVDWIMNSAGNETMKRAPITEARTQYGRAQIANMMLLKREVGRLSSLYEEELEKNKLQEFDENTTVE